MNRTLARTFRDAEGKVFEEHRPGWIRIPGPYPPPPIYELPVAHYMDVLTLDFPGLFIIEETP